MNRPVDRVLPLSELSYELLRSIGASFIGREYIGGRKSANGSTSDVAGLCFTRYFNAEGGEVAYRSSSGVETAYIFATPRIWGVPRPQLKPLTETNWS